MPRFETKGTEVDAIRANVETRLAGTSEVAARGDWIVTTSMGATFVVADAIFRTVYVPRDREAEDALRTLLPEDGAV